MIMKTQPFKIYGMPQKQCSRGKFIAIQAFLIKDEKIKPKVCIRKEIIKIREEINKIEIQNRKNQ